MRYRGEAADNEVSGDFCKSATFDMDHDWGTQTRVWPNNELSHKGDCQARVVSDIDSKGIRPLTDKIRAITTGRWNFLNVVI